MFQEIGFSGTLGTKEKTPSIGTNVTVGYKPDW